MARNLDLFDGDIATLAARLSDAIAVLPLPERVEALNKARTKLHEVSPFAEEPVDLVLWVLGETVDPNDYNPNKIAPPEMRLLELSIRADGVTQPIVAHQTTDGDETVDGFHRGRVCRSVPVIRERLHGYVPITRIKSDRSDRSDRVAATIRHNRARGRHGVEPMASIVGELRTRGWDDARIAKELGMDADEVLRLKQITGLKDLFADREYSKAWEPA